MKNDKSPSVGNAQEQPPMQSVGSDELVRRFAFRKHTNPRVSEWMPDELEVGWQFTDASGKTHFVKWGCTKNRDSLQRLITDVMRKHGEMEVVDLDSPNTADDQRRGE